MAKFMNKVKLAWLKGVEVVGTSASNLASNAKFKVAEINLETRRREVMAEFTQKAYELWQNGTALPEPLNGMLQEACDLDERLSVLRAQRYAAVDCEAAKPAPEKAAEEGGPGEGDVPETLAVPPEEAIDASPQSQIEAAAPDVAEAHGQGAADEAAQPGNDWQSQG
ncbi:MAG: hypothetical protein VB099_19500 [Candidatus Limiplasma sp.]|nr:hypothetical protein [Candidatus Limiplasma sp.]